MRRIGQGTYGSVYRGMCNGEEVAVKVLQSNNTAEDIEREIRIMSGGKSLYIIQLLDAFKVMSPTGVDVWLVMEFCCAGSTLDMMRRQGKPFTEQQSAWVVKGVAHALFFVHTVLNAIHRDIKVAN